MFIHLPRGCANTCVSLPIQISFITTFHSFQSLGGGLVCLGHIHLLWRWCNFCPVRASPNSWRPFPDTISDKKKTFKNNRHRLMLHNSCLVNIFASITLSINAKSCSRSGDRDEFLFCNNTLFFDMLSHSLLNQEIEVRHP